MGEKIVPGQKPGPVTRYNDVISGIGGEVSGGLSQTLQEYQEGIGRINSWAFTFLKEVPDIVALSWQDIPEGDLFKQKLKTGYVFAEYEDDPAVLVIRRIQNPQESGGQIQYRRVVGLDGMAAPAVQYPSTLPIVLATDRFVLQQVSEVDDERVGPRYNFGTPLVYATGRSARIYTYGGWLVDNIRDGSAQAQWWVAYNKYMRGSKCIQNKCFAELYYRDKIRRGYIMHTNMSEDASQPNRAQFAFSLFVTSEATFSIHKLRVYDAPPPKGPSREIPANYKFGFDEGGSGGVAV